MLKTKDAFCHPALERLITKQARINGVDDDENLEKIKGYITLAIQADFYCLGSLKVAAEEMFEEKNDEFWIIGYIDCLAEYSDKIILKDFKTSKMKFSKKDLEFSVQALMYLMIARMRYPDKKRFLEFHQLQDITRRDKTVPFPIQVVTAEDDVLDGFREWLKYISNYLKDFDREKAMANFAKSDFAKSRMCCGGEMDEIKADGTKRFYCPQKYPNIYFALSENGKVLSTAQKKADLEKTRKEGQIIEEKIYEGCPAWKFLWEKKN